MLHWFVELDGGSWPESHKRKLELFLIFVAKRMATGFLFQTFKFVLAKIFVMLILVVIILL